MKASDLRRFICDPVGFIDRFITRNEKNQPWTLSPYQRKVLTLTICFDTSGRLLLRLLLWSEPKKSGKTFLAAALGLWWALTRPYTEVIVAANDLEQSISRVFTTMVKLCDHNAALGRSVKIKAAEITVTNGTTIKAIPSDYRGEAGPRHSLCVFDELWGFDSERAQRLFEEMTPVPTEENAWILVATTAGFTGESVLLERLYQRGLTGERLDGDLEVYQADDLRMFWSHASRQPWQTEQYYREQERLLRPNTFRRLHRNEWVSVETAFITAEMWDACVEPDWSPLEPTQEHPLWVGVDASTKRDSTAVVAVLRDPADGLLVLARHRIWRPSPERPLDLEAVEIFLLDLARAYNVRRIVCDPYQLHGTIQRLRYSHGLPMEEFPQTPERLTQAGQNLYDLIKHRKLVMYPDEEFRQQALSATALESERGFRISKDRSSKKIDAIISLAMAASVAVAEPVPVPLFFV